MWYIFTNLWISNLTMKNTLLLFQIELVRSALWFDIITHYDIQHSGQIIVQQFLTMLALLLQGSFWLPNGSEGNEFYSMFTSQIITQEAYSAGTTAIHWYSTRKRPLRSYMHLCHQLILIYLFIHSTHRLLCEDYKLGVSTKAVYCSQAIFDMDLFESKVIDVFCLFLFATLR